MKSTAAKIKKKASGLSPKRTRQDDAVLEYAVKAQPWKPHAYQRRAVKWLLEHAGAGLFLDPGLGKTSITLAAFSLLKKQKQSDISLVIAPLRVCHSVWPVEAQKWTDFKHLRVGVLHGKNKEQVLEDAIENGSYDVLCINPEGLDWLFGVTKRKGRNGKTQIEVDKARMKWLFGPGAITDLAVDESTKFKHSSSLRFKVLKESLSRFRRRWILTGTPSPNGLIDLFGQCFIIDMGASLGEYITHYRQTFFDAKGFGGYTFVPKAGSKEAIYARLKKSVLRLDAKDYLELPELVPNNIKFDLPDKARELYDLMEEDMVAEMDGKTYTALNAASAMTKCAQIANGGLYKQKDPIVSAKRMRGADSWELIHNSKDEIVADLVEEISGQPVLIAYEFQHDLERLLKVFGKDTPYIGGGVSPKRSKQIEDAWNRGEIPVLLGHPASMGHGLNLQNAGNHVIWYGITYDYELYDQFIRRVLRQGSKHKRVFVHHIIARDTVDELKLYALLRKKKGQNNLLDAIRTYVRDRRAKVSSATRSRPAAPAAKAATPRTRPAPRAQQAAPAATPATRAAALRQATRMAQQADAGQPRGRAPAGVVAGKGRRR